jgi:hypothetical protein
VGVSERLSVIQHREVIEESDSPWPSPIILVRKKNEELHFCMDYRKLNDVTKKDCFPLPWIDNTLRNAGWSQMVLHSQSEEQVLASRCTRRRQGENCILDGSRLMAVYHHPFGLCNALATFKRLVTEQSEINHRDSQDSLSEGVQCVSCYNRL